MTTTTLARRDDVKTAHLALMAVQLCFGSFPVVGKLAFAGFAPATVATWRVLSATLVLVLLARWRHPGELRLPRADLILAFWLSFLGVTLNQLLYINGLALTTAVNAGLLMALIPVMTYAFAVLARREALVGRKVLGVLCGTGGLAVLFLGRGARLEGSQTLGLLMLVGNVSAYSLHLVLAKPLLSRTPPLVALAWIFGFGAIIVPFFSLGHEWVPVTASREAWWALAWIIAVPTIAGYLLNMWSLARVDASVTAIYTCTQPLITAALAFVFLREVAGPESVVTGVLVLLGVLLVTSGSTRRR